MSRLAIPLALSVVFVLGCNSKSLEERAKQINAATLGPGNLTQEAAAKVLAKVGDRTITLGDYAAALERMNEFDRMRYQAPEKRKELLNEMIEFELLTIEAKRRGLDKSPEVEIATRQILRDALLAEARKSLPSLADLPVAEVRAYYEAHREEYREPERRRVAAIVLKDKGEAEKLLSEAKKANPTEWGKLALKHLDGPKPPPSSPVETAGELGIVSAPSDPKGANPNVPEEVRAAVFEINGAIGSVLDRVVPSGGRFYILKLAGRTAAHERSFAEAERSIRGKLMQQKLEERELQLEEELKKKFPLSVDEAALAQVQVPGSSPEAPSHASAAPSSSAPHR